MALAITMGVAGGALALGGYAPGAAFRALVGGAMGSSDAFLSISLVRSVPLLFTGLAVALAFRSGIWNIGAEGQLYAGAVAAVWVGLAGAGLPAAVLLPAVLVAAAAGGAAWAWLPAYLRVRRGVGEVITTLLLNFVAIHLAAWMVHGPLQEARGVFPSTDQIPAAARLPLLVEGTRLHWGFPLALGSACAIWLLFRNTVFGFRLRAGDLYAARQGSRGNAVGFSLCSFCESLRFESRFRIRRGRDDAACDSPTAFSLRRCDRASAGGDHLDAGAIYRLGLYRSAAGSRFILATDPRRHRFFELRNCARLFCRRGSISFERRLKSSGDGDLDLFFRARGFCHHQ
jgi:hypothetical protein